MASLGSAPPEEEKQLHSIDTDSVGLVRLFTGVGFLRINLAVDGTNRGFVAALALLTAF